MLRGARETKDVAAALGVARAVYHAWEKGRLKPGYDALCALCLYYNVPADDLLGIADCAHDPSVLTRRAVIAETRHEVLAAELERYRALCWQHREAYHRIDHAEVQSRNRVLLWLGFRGAGSIRRCRGKGECPFARDIDWVKFARRWLFKKPG